MKKLTNTSVIAKYKNGNEQTFETIEEASKVTGLSINSIKSRASKEGSGSKSKDGITFIWADPAVRRSKLAKRNKTKGSNFELEVVHKLRNVGYEGCVSSRSQDKMADSNKIDIIDMNNELNISIQAKYTQNLPNYFDIRDACTIKNQPFIMMWKKAGKNGAQSPGTVAILPAEYFYELIKKNNMIVIQSFNDIITNSSSELFVSDTSLSEEEIISFLSKVSYGYLKPVKFNLKEYRNWRGTNTPSDIFETVEGWFSDPENENDIIDYYLRRLAWEDIPKKFMKKFNRLLSSLKIPSCVCPTELNDIEEIRKFLLSEPVPECMKIADKDNAELLDGKWLVLSEYDNSMPSITFDFIEKILNANRYHLG